MTNARRKGRILAMQALYAWEACSAQSVEELVAFSWLEEDKRNDIAPELTTFTQILIMGTIQNIKPVDTMIRKHLKNWDFSRLGRVDLAILRMSVYPLMYQKEEMPASIVINEAIGIAREYSSDDSYRFVNGVLDSIHKSIKTNDGAFLQKECGQEVVV
jgi:N utilization substance protein B